MGRKYIAALLLAGSVLAATPALADVKAGVDAWTSGDYATAVKEWQGPAVRGDADAQFNLAQAYKLGRGVPQDLTKAEALFAQAAARGHLQAADNYGLLLFQRGERAKALPFISAAAERGDPRAQYLLGIAHFNGDIVPKDWVRAYALVSLAQQAGLDQAKPALAQMDSYIPLDQRQQAVALSSQLAQQAEAARARQMAAADLGTTVPTGSPPVRVAAATPVPAPVRPPVIAATAPPAGTPGGDSPRYAGADYARPAQPAVASAIPPPTPRPTPVPRPVAVATPAPPPAVATASGPWRVQLGAFGVAANADAAWNRAKGQLAGHPRINVRAGNVIRVQAGGFASEAAARAACAKLSAAGSTCIAVRN
jgi:cell division protein FtsN